MTATEQEQERQAPEQKASHVLHRMDHTGDSKLMWDDDTGPEVDAARAMFDTLRGRGYLAYSVDPQDGSKGEVLREFDPQVKALIMTPPLQGG